MPWADTTILCYNGGTRPGDTGMKTIELRISERFYLRLRTALMTRAMIQGGGRPRSLEAFAMKILHAYENDEPIIELKVKGDEPT